MLSRKRTLPGSTSRSRSWRHGKTSLKRRCATGALILSESKPEVPLRAERFAKRTQWKLATGERRRRRRLEGRKRLHRKDHPSRRLLRKLVRMRTLDDLDRRGVVERRGVGMGAEHAFRQKFDFVGCRTAEQVFDACPRARQKPRVQAAFLYRRKNCLRETSGAA